MTVLPPEIGNLSNLERLDLHDNQLTVLPPEIGNLVALRELFLEDNALTVLPPEIGHLTGLRWILLHRNQLTTLPIEITLLTGLEGRQNGCIYEPGLRLCGNPLTISDPAVETFVIERDREWPADCPDWTGETR